ncbi:hypothetical protein H310_00090 [Aphanomyces invadans]|uniref:Uncharacterized protein n=1 Tax=Aphanomyces invadans TaxID=157072 RepID=A0A024UT69_9STRA|nr:hypothetical protein H310_00090 [Aphanomyces invadans]ETW09534.1 hypothetical protein H310_00090 [Aphanomyces invadans]|eukprot:XP_008860945.1 hypothetical protein H310_00090 [Aphanomyces invadans]
MNEAVTISAAAMEEQQAMAATMAVQQHQLEHLKQSKQLLQNAMLEQLAAVRKQLQMERIARLTAESRRGDGMARASQPVLSKDELDQQTLFASHRKGPDTMEPRDIATHVPRPQPQPPLPSLSNAASSTNENMPSCPHVGAAHDDALTLVDLAGATGPTAHDKLA